MGNYNAYRTTRHRRLPILLAILLFAIFVYFMTRKSLPVCTSSLERQQQHAIYTKIIKDFVRRFDEGGISFMIFGSTLLGSYRHHGLIPYDNNIIHFAVNSSSVDSVRALLIEANYSSTSFNFTSYDVDDMDIFICPLPEIGPSIRISNFLHIGPHIRFSGVNKSLPLTSVFPLTLRPYETMLLPSPACPSLVLGLLYNLELCCKHELHVQIKPKKCYSCSFFKKTAFIERRRYTDQVMLEQLWQNDRAVGPQKLLNEDLCNVP